MNSGVKRTAFTGMLGALAVTLAFLESLIPPVPLMPPGSKLGLSNIVTMYAAGTLGLPYALCIAVLKGGFAFLTRGMTAGIMSICGGLASTFIMWMLLRYSKASLAAVGVAGALSHNAMQLCAAYILTGTSVWLYVPFMLVFGFITGVLTGLGLKILLPRVEAVSRLFIGRGDTNRPQ